MYFTEINILEHKSFKLKIFIIQQTKEKKSVQRLIDRELFRVEQLSKKQYQNKSNYSDLEAKYNDLTVEYMAKLKVHLKINSCEILFQRMNNFFCFLGC